MISEIELRADGLEFETGEFGVHLEANGFVRLDADDELVVGCVGEEGGGGVFELDADFGFGFVEGWGAFFSFKDRGNERSLGSGGFEGGR